MATPVKQPQNREVTVAVLRALDDNLGKYHTVEEQNDFLQALSDKHNFVWEGKGRWNDRFHSFETLRRVLNRLAQDRRPEYRELPGDDKTHDRVHAMFRIGSALIKPERLRDYNYVSPHDAGLVDGKRKRRETEAFKEFREAAQRARESRRSDIGTYSGRQSCSERPAAKRQRASLGSDPVRTSYRASSGPDWTWSRTRDRSWKSTGDSGQAAESGGEDGSSEYEDAIQYDPSSIPDEEVVEQRNGLSNGASHSATNGKRPANFDDNDDEEWPAANGNNQSNFGGQYRAETDGVDGPMNLAQEVIRLHKSIERLSRFFYRARGYQSAILAYDCPAPVRDLYNKVLHAYDWRPAAGRLLEQRALSGRDFIQSLVWTFLRTHIFEKDHAEAPLWKLFDQTDFTHQYLREHMEGRGREKAEEGSGYVLLRTFLRRVALTQLYDEDNIKSSFIRPTAWKLGFQLRDILAAHSPALRAGRPPADPKEIAEAAMVIESATSEADARILMLCKEICLSAFAVHVKVRVCSDRAEWLWPSSGSRFDAKKMTAAGTSDDHHVKTVATVAVGVMPGLRWLPADDVITVVDGGRSIHVQDGAGTEEGAPTVPQEWKILKPAVRLLAGENSSTRS